MTIRHISMTIIAIAVTTMAFAQKSNELKSDQTASNIREARAESQGSYTPDFKVDGKNTKVRNIILMIGDGMGLGAVNSGHFANGKSLTMTNLKTFGLVRTQSANAFTTDSAASGTAYATGIKTNNGYIGMGPDDENITNIPEAVAPLGYACGVLSTDDVNGATPAAFFAHQLSRGMTKEIWGDIPACSLTFLSAGSRSVFESMPQETIDGIKNKFSVVFSPDDPAIASSDRLLYLPESVQLDERGDYLGETTRMAINYLSQKSRKGFFLMVEGARIDKESHGNNMANMVREVLDFDKAIEEAVRFAEKDGHTLVIISADHETGALSLLDGDPEEGFVKGAYSSFGHSPMTVPLFAYGPRSREFTGIQENSDVSNKIRNILSGKK